MRSLSGFNPSPVMVKRSPAYPEAVSRVVTAKSAGFPPVPVAVLSLGSSPEASFFLEHPNDTTPTARIPTTHMLTTDLWNNFPLITLIIGTRPPHPCVSRQGSVHRCSQVTL